jgi:cell division protein FtsB
MSKFSLLNYIRTRQLRFMMEVGRRDLMETRQQVAQLEENVEGLNTEVAVQKLIADRIRTGLDSTRSLLDATILEVFQICICTCL